MNFKKIVSLFSLTVFISFQFISGFSNLVYGVEHSSDENIEECIQNRDLIIKDHEKQLADERKSEENIAIGNAKKKYPNCGYGSNSFFTEYSNRCEGKTTNKGTCLLEKGTNKKCVIVNRTKSKSIEKKIKKEKKVCNSKEVEGEECFRNIASVSEGFEKEDVIVRIDVLNKQCTQPDVVKDCKKEFKEWAKYYLKNDEKGEKGQGSYLKKVGYYKCVAKKKQEKEKLENEQQEAKKECEAKGQKCVEINGKYYRKDQVYLSVITEKVNGGELTRENTKLNVCNGVSYDNPAKIKINGSFVDNISDENGGYYNTKCCREGKQIITKSGKKVCISENRAERKGDQCISRQKEIIDLYNSLAKLVCLKGEFEKLGETEEQKKLFDEKKEDYQKDIENIQSKLKKEVESFKKFKEKWGSGCKELTGMLPDSIIESNYEENIKGDMCSKLNLSLEDVSDINCIEVEQLHAQKEKVEKLAELNKNIGNGTGLDDLESKTEEYKQALKIYQNLKKKLSSKDGTLEADYLICKKFPTSSKNGGSSATNGRKCKEIWLKKEIPTDKKEVTNLGYGEVLKEIKLIYTDAVNIVAPLHPDGWKKLEIDKIKETEITEDDIKDITRMVKKSEMCKDEFRKNFTVDSEFMKNIGFLKSETKSGNSTTGNNKKEELLNQLSGYISKLSSEIVSLSGNLANYESEIKNLNGSELEKKKTELENTRFNLKLKEDSINHVKKVKKLVENGDIEEMGQKFASLFTRMCDLVNSLSVEKMKETKNNNALISKKSKMIDCIAGSLDSGEVLYTGFTCKQFLDLEDPLKKEKFWDYEITECNKCGQNFNDNGYCCEGTKGFAGVLEGTDGSRVCCGRGQFLSGGNGMCCSVGVTDGEPKECIRNDYGSMGISCTPKQLINGSCSLSTYKTLQIRKNTGQKADPKTFIQDIILGITSFVGVVATVSLLVSGFKYVIAGAGQEVSNAKKGIIYSVIGIFLVAFSYAIIRLIQYIAKG